MADTKDTKDTKDAAKADKVVEETALAAAVAPKKAPIAVGDVVMLQATVGYLVNMTNPAVTFDTDRVTKCEVDNWIKMQYDEDKLELA